jgi:hypothetical protein
MKSHLQIFGINIFFERRIYENKLSQYKDFKEIGAC